MQHLHLFGYWYLVFFASRSFTFQIRVLVACRVFPTEGKAGLFSQRQVSQKVSMSEARYGVSYIHVHSCTLMYQSIYNCIGTCLDAAVSAEFRAREKNMIVLGTTGGTVCTCGCSCTCMYVYRTIPYIPISKEVLECVNGGPWHNLFYFSPGFPSLLGF